MLLLFTAISFEVVSPALLVHVVPFPLFVYCCCDFHSAFHIPFVRTIIQLQVRYAPIECLIVCVSPFMFHKSTHFLLCVRAAALPSFAPFLGAKFSILPHQKDSVFLIGQEAKTTISAATNKLWRQQITSSPPPCQLSHHGIRSAAD